VHPCLYRGRPSFAGAEHRLPRSEGKCGCAANSRSGSPPPQSGSMQFSQRFSLRCRGDRCERLALHSESFGITIRIQLGPKVIAAPVDRVRASQHKHSHSRPLPARRSIAPNSEISKSSAKVFVVDGRELKQMSRLSVKIWTRERKYCPKAALCARCVCSN